MNQWKAAWKSIRYRSLHHSLSVILLAISTGLILLLLNSRNSFEDSFRNNIKGIDMVVGAKGSPLQIILSSVYHIDPPTGNIPLDEYKKLIKHPLIEAAVPLSYGDNFRSWRIVGTDSNYAHWYSMQLAEGRGFQKSMEVVLGSAVAEATGLQVGDTFEGSHGLNQEAEEHHHHPFKVVGIYQASGTVLDELILCPTASLWDVHEHAEGPKEITAALIRFKSPMANIMLPRMVNEKTPMQAALPAIEVNRLFSLADSFVQFLNILAYLLIGIAALSVFLALFQGLKDDEPQFAFLRAIGSPPSRILKFILVKGLIIGLISYALALILNIIAFQFIGSLVSPAYQLSSSEVLFNWNSIYTLAALIGVVIFASVLPAWHAYRINIIKTLAHA
ncbi:ABC transporter permease [Croceimicrobium sp.]|uniref:ABC transporter permease n=1 Tax=Croceimicrobium sp. TaxID=2828340 RepID=UPI003BA8E3AD